MLYELDMLGHVCDREGGIIQTGPFGSQLHERDYVPEGIPTIMPKDIVDGRINRESVARITERKADELARHKLRIGAVVLPRRGEINKRAFITEEEQGWLCGTGCIKVELEGTELLPQFLYYYLDLPTTVKWLEQHAVGSTMLNLSASIVRSLPVILPPLGVQKRIAAILSSYDDLIENNLRRIQLLEQAARLIYREWFVRLRFPGHERVRVVDGVPEEWEQKHLDRVADVNQQQLKGSHQGIIEYVDISSVSPGSIDATQTVEFEMAPGRARRVVRHGDVIWSCVRPNRRSHAIIWNPRPNLIVSTGFAVITPRQVPTSYLYYALTTDAFVSYLTNRARGGAYPAVLASDFEDAELLIPPETLIGEFNSLVRPMIDQRANLQLQNERLRIARDLLLPRLMSGQIEV